MNFLTILSALKTIDCLHFFKNALLFQKNVKFSLRFIEIKNKTRMGNVVVIGSQKLQTVFGTYKQFVGQSLMFIDLYGMASWYSNENFNGKNISKRLSLL